MKLTSLKFLFMMITIETLFFQRDITHRLLRSKNRTYQQAEETKDADHLPFCKY